MPHKLTSGEIHFLRLIAKGQQCPAGWAPVSKVLYPLVKEMPTELVEHCSVEQTGGGIVRLKPEGENILRALERL